MKKTRHKLTLVTVLALAIAATAVLTGLPVAGADVAVASSAVLLTKDTSTGKAYASKYPGAKGYILPAPTASDDRAFDKSLPSGATFAADANLSVNLAEFPGAGAMTTNLPGRENGTLGAAVAYGNNASFDFYFAEYYQVAIFIGDESRGDSAFTVTDGSGNSLCPDVATSNAERIAGVYAVFAMKGAVNVKSNSTVPFVAIFIDEFQVPLAEASKVGKDANTKGDWTSAYGAEGYIIPKTGGALSPTQLIDNSRFYYQMPEGASVTMRNFAEMNPTYVRPIDPDASGTRLYVPGDCTMQLAQIIAYGDAVVALDFNFADNAEHTIAIYFADHDGAADTDRGDKTITVRDMFGTKLGDEIVILNADVKAATYAVFKVKGKVTVEIEKTRYLNGADAQIFNAVFVGGAVASSQKAGATFVKKDAETKGAWQTAYGAEGWLIPYGSGNAANSGSMADSSFYKATAGYEVKNYGITGVNFDKSGAASGIKLALPGTEKSALPVISGTDVQYDFFFKDSAAHTVAFYFADTAAANTVTLTAYDINYGYAIEEFETVVAANDFTGGVYMVLSIKGNVRVELSGDGVANSAIFVGGAFEKDTASGGNEGCGSAISGAAAWITLSALLGAAVVLTVVKKTKKA